MNFYIDAESLTSSYLLQTITTDITELYADETTLVDVFPPFQLVSASTLTDSSYVTVDTYSDTSGDTSLTIETLLSGTKIMGPV